MVKSEKGIWCVLLTVASMGFLSAEPRVWTSGKSQIKAEFVSLKDDDVILKRGDGLMTKPIPLDRLSNEDQEFVRAMTKENPAVPKPAETEQEENTLTVEQTTAAKWHCRSAKFNID